MYADQQLAMDRQNNGVNNPGNNPGDSSQYVSPPPPSSEVPSNALALNPRGWCLAAQLPVVPPAVSSVTAEPSSSSSQTGQAQAAQSDGDSVIPSTRIRLLEYLIDSDGRTHFTGKERNMSVVDPVSGEEVELIGIGDPRWGVTTHLGPNSKKEKKKKDKQEKKDQKEKKNAVKLRGGARGDCFREPVGCLGYWLGQICSD